MTGTSSVLSDDDLHFTAACFFFRDNDLSVNPLLQLCDMGDDSHQPVILRQIKQCSDRLPERFFIERAKPFIHKHGIQPDPARGRLDLIRKAQRKGKGRLEGFSSGERFDTSLRPIVMVKNANGVCC